MSTYVDTVVTVKGIAVEVCATGTVSSGGSRGYGSDEPPWCEVEDLEFWHGAKHLPRPVVDAISGAEVERIKTLLMEAYDAT